MRGYEEVLTELLRCKDTNGTSCGRRKRGVGRITHRCVQRASERQVGHREGPRSGGEWRMHRDVWMGV